MSRCEQRDAVASLAVSRSPRAVKIAGWREDLFLEAARDRLRGACVNALPPLTLSRAAPCIPRSAARSQRAQESLGVAEGRSS